MVLPYGAEVGFWVEPDDHEMMTGLGTLLSSCPDVQFACRCAGCSAVTAWAHVIPASDGTVTLGGPAEGTTVTVEPSFNEVVGAGFCEITTPNGTLMDLTGAASFMCRCSLVRS